MKIDIEHMSVECFAINNDKWIAISIFSEIRLKIKY